MDVPTHDEMLGSIERFLARHAMRHTRFGTEVNGEAGLVKALRDGKRSPSLRLLGDIAAFMARKDRDAGFRHGVDDAAPAAVPSAGNEADHSRAAVTHG